MQTREDADFPVILDILKSTEGASKSPNGNHILKWVLRFVSQLPLPPPGSGDEDPVAVKQKADALKAGKQLLNNWLFAFYSGLRHCSQPDLPSFLEQGGKVEGYGALSAVVGCGQTLDGGIGAS